MKLVEWLLRCTRPGCRVFFKVFGDGIKEAGQWPDGIGFLYGGGETGN